MARHTDALVIGGGIAGVSIAYELAADRAVTLLEMESTLAFHTTGRSAAIFIESYGNLPVRALTVASRTALTDPSDIFDGPLVSPRPLLYVAGAGSGTKITQLYDDVRELTPDVELLDPADVPRVNPLVRKGYTEAAMLDPTALDIDVHALHQGYLRGFRARGGQVVMRAPVTAARKAGVIWNVETSGGEVFSTPVAVNAAGAWCDQVATIFGAAPIGVKPLRRTAFTVPAPDRVRDLPLLDDIDDRFYLKPEGDSLLCSPADETPQLPGNARPDETEMARAIEAINAATTLDVRHVGRSWAGLRSFTPDRTPVTGFASDVEGLFWFAGQGGYGIQISPAFARMGAALVRDQSLPADIAIDAAVDRRPIPVVPPSGRPLNRGRGC